MFDYFWIMKKERTKEERQRVKRHVCEREMIRFSLWPQEVITTDTSTAEQGHWDILACLMSVWDELWWMSVTYALTLVSPTVITAISCFSYTLIPLSSSLWGSSRHTHWNSWDQCRSKEIQFHFDIFWHCKPITYTSYKLSWLISHTVYHISLTYPPVWVICGQREDSHLD